MSKPTSFSLIRGPHGGRFSQATPDTRCEPASVSPALHCTLASTVQVCVCCDELMRPFKIQISFLKGWMRLTILASLLQFVPQNAPQWKLDFSMGLYLKTRLWVKVLRNCSSDSGQRGGGMLQHCHHRCFNSINVIFGDFCAVGQQDEIVYLLILFA